jgi:hypothetical protein
MNQENHSHRGPTGNNGAGDRGRSLWRRLRARFGHRCNDLLASNQVLQHLSLEDTRHLGRRSVPLEKIVGSSGRHREFDLSFRPRRGASDRWLRIAQANGDDLPPVALYKVGDAYFVEDGNHRVSVARAIGKETIEAFVIEIDASRLRPEPSCQRLGYRV